jgi:hypothetical protein
VVGACGSGSQGPAGPAGPAGSTGSNGTDGANGEAGPPGPAATANPSVSGVEPPRSFLARNAEVTISGYGTSWSSTTTVDFGAGITVNKITVASPTALVAQITTSNTAATGPRDVTVHDGSTMEVFKGAFQVLSPIAVTTVDSLAQGGIAVLTFQVLDVSTPLDTTSVTDPLTGQVSYPNLALSLPANSGVSLGGFSSVSDFSASVSMAFDVNATAGVADMDLLSGPPPAMTADGGVGVPAGDVDFPMPKSLNVVARTATALTSGTAAAGNIMNPYDSALYSFTPASASLAILDFAAASTAMAPTPGFYLLPSSGTFAASLSVYGSTAAQTVVSTATTPFYAVYWDNSGAVGPYTMTATSVAPAATAAASAADAVSTAAIVASALPFVLTGGDLTTQTQDWVKITLTAAATLHLQTAGDPLTDIQVSVYESDGVTLVPNETQIDNGGFADGTVSIPAAGTYLVQFAQGMGFATPDTTYNGIIRTE